MNQPLLTNSTYGNETLIQNPDLCTAKTCSLDIAEVEYYPSLAGNALFLAIFALLIVLQLGFGYKTKTWSFCVVTISGLILEVIGYLGRIMLHHNPWDHSGFLIDLICLTIAPAFLTAGLYLCLGRIVVAFGTSNSRFEPRTYTVIFCACDLFSLVLQAIGGGIAATSNSNQGTLNGQHIMIAGLAFQVFSLLVFGAFCGEFAWRVYTRKGTRNETYLDLTRSFRFKAFLFALLVASVTIFTRCVFRVAELEGGFHGKLANEQVTFMILEGTMIIIAEISMTVFHPGLSFQGHWVDASFPWRPFKTLWSPKARAALNRPEKSYQPSAESVENVGEETNGEAYRGRSDV